MPVNAAAPLQVGQQASHRHGTPGTQWRLESRDALTGTNAWQPLTNIALGLSRVVVQRPFDNTSRFYRGAWVP